MNITKKILTLLLTGVMSIGTTQAADILAFPGAAGWGRYAKGARASSSPTVYHVTNLKDSGTGSLRDAISQPNRIIVFDVAGVIKISDRLVFSNNIYVAGQTAPGEGITVYGNGVSFSGASNIICRYMRIRMGHGGSSGKDCAGVANGTNMIFDHCSFSWGLDETFSINAFDKAWNITLMNCIIGQGLMTHSAGGLMQADSISLYRNLYIDNATRNNKVKGTNQYCNNVVYNWKNGCYIMGGDSEGSSYVNIEGNLFINGPAGGGTALGGGNSNFHFYGEDNWQDSNKDGELNPTLMTATGGGDQVSTPYAYPELELYPGDQLLTLNIPYVGASLPYRDQSDCYMIDELMSLGTDGALISNEENLPIGAPDTWSWYAGTTRVDTDGDGMPDDWENANGTDPNKDDATVKAANGYLNIENYINSITVDDRQYFLRQPITLGTDKSTTSTITLSWRDYTYAEDGFIVEYKEKDATDYIVAGRTEANATSYVITGLKDGTFYDTRVCAFGTNNGTEVYSDYATHTTNTRAAEVGLVDIDSYEADVTLSASQDTWDKTTTAWQEGKAFEDGNNVLLNTETTQTVSVTETVEPASVVVNGTGNLTVSGVISGSGSLNKGNSGTLVLNGKNDYTGATVNYDGTIEFNSIANGGEASAIGASQKFSQNWIFDGGTYSYTGSSASTDRNALLKSASTLKVASGKTLTMNGTIEGTSDFILDGEGTLAIPGTEFFGYTGATKIKGGILYLSTVDAAKNGIGSSSKIILAGGTLKTKGETEGYETYSFPIEVEEGTYSNFAPNRCCYTKSKITGAGTFEYTIPYLREYFDADISEFTGKIVANGVSSDSWGALMMPSGSTLKMPTTQVELTGNAKLCIWGTNGTGYIGGLSGDAGTYLMASSKKTTTAVCSWTIGGSNSDETFNGIINNSCCASGYTAKTNDITKVGTGYWRLNGKNTYVGTTTVNGGALIVNGNSSSATGNYIVNSEATLQGQGTIGGAVTVKDGGILCAGDTLYGKSLTLNKAVTIEKGGTMQVPLYNLSGKNTQMSFKMASSLTLKDGAILELDMSNVKNLEKGSSFVVFSQVPTSVTGTFTISPETPGDGMKWDTSDLFETGKIYAVDVDAKPLTYASVTYYSWESPEGTVKETGGIASSQNLTSSTTERVNYESTIASTGDKYYTMIIAGKYASMDAATATTSTQHIRIDLDDALAANDTIWVTAYRNKNSDVAASLYIDYGGKTSLADTLEYNNIYDGTQKPNTHYYVVPSAAAGAKYLRLSRNSASTNLFITKFLVTRWEKSAATGVESVRANNSSSDITNSPLYNLSGQRVDKNYRGITVTKGRKILK